MNITNFRAWMENYAKMGFSFITLKTGSKSPTTSWKKYQTSRPDLIEIEKWANLRSHQNIAIVTGRLSGLLVIDVDSEAALEELKAYIDDLSKIPMVSTGRGAHLYFQDSKDVLGNRTNVTANVDVRAEGGYVVAPPSFHPSGHQYKWIRTIEDVGGLPVLPEALRRLITSKQEKKQTKAIEDLNNPANAQKSIAKRIKQLDSLNNGERNDGFFKISYDCIKTASKSGVNIDKVITELVLKADSIGLDSQEIKDTMKSALRNVEADQAQAEEISQALMRSSVEHFAKVNHVLNKLDSDLDIRQYWTNDAGNARLFADLFKGNVLYDHNESQWYFRNGHIWKPDEEKHVTLLGLLCTEARSLLATKIGDEELKDKHMKAAASARNRNKLMSFIDLAKSLPVISFNGKTWDQGKQLLPVANGIVDLKSSSFAPISPRMRFRKYVDVKFDIEATAPRWITFLNEIFQNDQELITWIQKAIGYTMTGETTDQVFFICHGDGSNGKSLFLRMMKMILGTYAYSASSSTFDADNMRGTDQDLASMEGKRLITISEISEGMRLNTGLVKLLSVGDTVNARALYRMRSEYKPEFKLWFAVNHKPKILDQDFGIWRRVLTIPFNATFTGKNADPNLEEKLIQELEGILAWAIQGAARWYADNQKLADNMPASVQSYTEAYRGESDPLKDFIEEVIEISPDGESSAQSLYAAYEGWAKARHVSQNEILNFKAFGERLGKKYRKIRKNSGNFYLDIKLRNN